MNDTLVEWGVAIMPLPGQAVSGDGYIIKPMSYSVLAAVVDGLGHGYEAAFASKIAINTLDTYAREPVISLVRRCHEALRGTRGVVMSIASLSSSGRMIWLGVGNVEGILLRADERTVPPRESLIVRGGVLGYQLHALRAYAVRIVPGDTLIFVTDGIYSSFYQGLNLSDKPQRIADDIMARCARGTDDALVLAVRFVG